MSETFHNEKKFSSQNGLSMFNKSWGIVNHWAPLISFRDALYKLVVRHSGDSKFRGGALPPEDLMILNFFTNTCCCPHPIFIFLPRSKLLVQNL